MTHFEKCLLHVREHYSDLRRKALSGEINEAAIDGLMTTFLEQPAYFPEWRSELLRLAKETA